MHAGLFIDTYYPVIDGVTNIVDAYASRLVKKCDVTVFTPSVRDTGPEYDDRYPYRVVRCKSVMRKTDTYPQGFPMVDPGFKAAVRAAKLDIIHIHTAYTMGLYAKSISRKSGIPMVGTIHSDFRPDVATYLGKGLGEMAVKLMMSAYNACEECWTVNDVVGKNFQRNYGLTRPYRVMPYSTDHHPVADRAASRSRVNAAYGLKDGDFVMAHVGRQDLQKREDFILRSMVELKKSTDDFKLLLVGVGNKHEYLKRMSSRLGLDDNVIFCGLVSDPEVLMDIYARTDLLLFPSESDTYGLVKIEAACQKTPTLFCEGTMVTDGITGEVNGFTVPNSEQAYAGGILRLYHDRGLLEKVGEGAFRDLYRTWDSNVDNLFENYKRIIESRKFV